MKKVIIAVLVSMALVGAVYGAANSLTVGGVDDLGAGTAPVGSPDNSTSADVSDVSWDIDDTDITKIEGATVTIIDVDLNTDSETCDVGLHVEDGGTGVDAVNTGVVISADDGTTGLTADSVFSPALVVADIVSVTVTLACDD